MSRFIFKGSVTLNGVDFYINADDARDAIKKARNGEFEFYETDGAETVDLEINAGTCEPN
jgi:hypothetical protein